MQSALLERTLRRRIAFVLLLALPHACVAAERWDGIAYAPGSQRVLYRETHWVDGKRHVVLYRCPDGRAFARKRIDTSPGDTSPDFELVDGRDNYRHGVQTTASGREVFVRDAGASTPRRAALAGGPVIDAGFDAFIRQSWQALAKERSRPLEFLLPTRLRAMTFDVSTTAMGGSTRSFRLRLGSLLGAVLPRIDVDYDAASRRLVRYRGPTDLRNGRGGQAVVDLRYPAQRRDNASAAALAAAEAEPLSGRCML